MAELSNRTEHGSHLYHSYSSIPIFILVLITAKNKIPILKNVFQSSYYSLEQCQKICDFDTNCDYFVYKVFNFFGLSYLDIHFSESQESTEKKVLLPQN